MSVQVVGDPAALSLAGHEATEEAARLVVVLDDAVAPGMGAAAVVRWWRAEPDWSSAGELVIAPQGAGLWSRAPWPVRDEVFALPPAAGQGVLVIDDSEAAREGLLEDLGRRGVAAEGAARLTRDALGRADVVVHGVGAGLPVPGDAFAVLAAGRLLVTTAAPGFGLVGGVDHLPASNVESACGLVEAVLAAPPVFGAMRRHARLAAERHRASAVYRALAAMLGPSAR